MKKDLCGGRFSSALVFTIAMLIAAGAVAQEPTFQLDFDSSNDTIDSSVIDPPPVFTGLDGPFKVTVVLSHAQNLMGVNCDLSFDNAHLQVVDIQETYSDLNFDGRANVFDIREIGERLNATEGQDLYEEFFDRAGGAPDGVIDLSDVDAIAEFFAEPGIFWTVNTDPVRIRESVEVFEDPSVSNENSVIDDIVCFLLPREHPPTAGFGFTGDARIAEITFQPVDGFVGTTTLTFTETWAVDEDTEVNEETGEITGDLTPQSQPVEITIQ